MRRRANIVAIFIMTGMSLGGCEARNSTSGESPAGSAAPSGEASPVAPRNAGPKRPVRHWVPGIKITLKPRRHHHFLGENILLDYNISYEGDGSLSAWSATGLGSEDCQVRATDRAGNRVPQSTLEPHHTGQGGLGVRSGGSATYTIPLMRYCRFEKPGVYRVRAAHTLGWRRSGDIWPPPAIPDDDPRWAETTIVLAPPNAAQARRVVEHMCQLRRDVEYYRHLGGVWKMADYADFICLQYPIYVPILEELARGTEGDKRAITGIAHIPTPEATEALFRLLEHPNPEVVRQTTAALCDRLPDPQGVTRPNRENPIEVEDADAKLVKTSWRSDFAVPARQVACKMLTEEDPIRLRCGAFILEAIGTQEDVPALIAAVNRTVPVVERTEPPRYIGHIAPVREACRDLVYAIDALAGRGIEPTPDPRMAGEIIHFVLAIKHRKDFRPAGWEERCADSVRQGTPYVREVVLFNAPRPLPESLLAQYKAGARKVIATTREQTVIHVAVEFALDVNIPVDEILELLVERLDSEEPALYLNLYMCLEDLLESGKHDHHHAACARIPSREELASVKAAWKRFLKKHGQSIRQGKHFSWRDPEVIDKLLY